MRIVVMLPGEIGPIPFYGIAHWESDPTLGNVLRVQPEHSESGSTVVFLSESLWAGTIEKVDSDDADYRFTPTGNMPPSS